MNQTARHVIVAIASLAGVLIGGVVGHLLDQDQATAGLLVGATVVAVGIWLVNRQEFSLIGSCVHTAVAVSSHRQWRRA